MAKLYFRYGAMGSGKTIDLLKVAYNYEEKGQKVLILSPETDDRFGKGIIGTRIGIKKESRCVSKDENIFNLVKNMINKPDAVLVDEVNFFTKNHIFELSDIVDYFGIPVICYGLRSDFKLDLFEPSSALLAIADSIEEIKTICECGKKATTNIRFINNKAVTEGEQIVIGGNDCYKSVCRKCYKKYINISKRDESKNLI